MPAQPQLNQNFPLFEGVGVTGELCWFAQAAKYYRLCGLNSRNVYSQSSGVWKSEMMVPAGLVSLEASLLDLQMAALLLTFHRVVPPYSRVSPCVLIFSPCVLIFSCKNTGLTGIGPTL